MTIQLLDQALDIAIALFVYGGEFWLASAFCLYVASRWEKEPKRIPAQDLAVKASTSSEASINFRLSEPLEKVSSKSGFIKVTIVEKVPKQADKTSLEPVSKPEAVPLTVPVGHEPVPLQVSCEPVNWALWKARDLRKASIAKACGVRTRPVGSRRNLPKADLIAQYKQNLKRFTHAARQKTDLQRTDLLKAKG